jgi:uncharacterized protein YwbE
MKQSRKEQMSPVGKMLVTQATYHLPHAVSGEIGRIIVHWAFLDHYIERTVYILLKLDQKRGRLALKDGTINDRINLISDLAGLQSIKLDETKLSAFKSKVKQAEERRNVFAHGLWTQLPDGSLRVQQVTGEYSKTVKVSHSRKRKIDPEGLAVTVDGLRTVTKDIEGLIQKR